LIQTVQRRNGVTASTLSRTQRFKAQAIATVVSPLAAALGRTLSWTVEGESHYDDVMRAGRPPILVFWHGRILPATLFWRDREIVVMISENFDGEWATQLIARFGYRAARGSTSRGGSRALLMLRRELAAGHPVGFAVDGPRGPARVVQPGAAWLSGATGYPIIPFHIEARRQWTSTSWDRAQVPKPFSRVALVVGAPVVVGSTDHDDVSQSCELLRQTLVSLESRALVLIDAAHGRPPRLDQNQT
jgi:lysophospholipid acyltransferase (LPLAT)-like uncharacterized protein